MADKDNKSSDILGIRPITEGASALTKAAIKGASAFLGRICLPAAEELGLLFQDKVRVWRAKNALKVIQAAQESFQRIPLPENARAHPRLVSAVLEHGSWSDDSVVQKMWGGLLASSCCEDGRDESNLIFISILSQMTSSQARVLAYACENAKKKVVERGLIMPQASFYADADTLLKVSGITDIHRLDRELDHLRGLELIQQGFSPGSLDANITPSALALNLYVRCQGFTGSPVEYFGVQPPNDKKTQQI